VQGSGSHFDPQVIQAFNEIDDATFERIGKEVR
jgi:response regulator RpfG family c-di-GMP phosphodiesterase